MKSPSLKIRFESNGQAIRATSHPCLCLVFTLVSVLCQIAVGQRTFRAEDYRTSITFGLYNHIVFQDRQGFLWGAGYNWGLAKFDGHTINNFDYDPADSTSLPPAQVFPGPGSTKILEDKEGKVWIKLNTVFKYDPVMEAFEQTGKIMEATAGKPIGYAKDIYLDMNGDVWIGTQIGIFQYQSATRKFHFHETKLPNVMVFEDKGGKICIGLKDSLFFFNQSNRSLEKPLPYPIPPTSESDPNGSHSYYVGFIKELDAHLLVVAKKGFLFYPQSKSFESLNRGLDGDVVCSAHVADDAVLLSTCQNVYQLEYGSKTFKFLEEFKTPNSWLLFRSKDGIVWIYDSETEHKFHPWRINIHRGEYPLDAYLGAYVYNYHKFFKHNGIVYINAKNPVPVRKDVTDYLKFDTSIPGEDSKQYNYLFSNSETGDLWMAAFKQPNLFLRKFDANGKITGEYACQSTGGNCFMPMNIAADNQGNVWMTADEGVYKFDLASKTFEYVLPLLVEKNSFKNYPFARQIIIRKNKLVVGFEGGAGVSEMDLQSRKVRRYYQKYGSQPSISGTTIWTLYVDNQDNLWVGADFGLNKISADGTKVIQYFEENGVPGSSADAFVEDNSGRLWMMEGSRYAMYDASRDVFIPFYLPDGAYAASTNIQPALSDKDGYLYFHAHSPGVHIPYFHSDSVLINQTAPDVYFNSMNLFNQPVKPGGEDGILQKALNFVDKITLRHDQNVFTISYNAPDFTMPDILQFAYQLEGFDKDWQEVGNKREATYTNLDPGTYTFKVKVRNHHGYWSGQPRTLTITVLPPWWKTCWAYLLYAIAIGGALYGIRNYELKRQLAKAEAQRLQELDSVKTRLYTNITHEFRTPLTVILGMLDQMKALFVTQSTAKLDQATEIIRRNGQHLLHLINQMLDLSKLESGKLQLRSVQGNVVQYLQYLAESFQSFAEGKNIRLTVFKEVDGLVMDYDPEKLQQIVSNLLSNAIKFTPEGGQIIFNFRETEINGQSNLMIKVKDSGTGIHADKLPHIFERFYQADDSHTRQGEGTGIGLALTKELVKLMNGSIGVKSEPGKGTEFTVMLPVSRGANLRFTSDDLRTGKAGINLSTELTSSIANRKSQIENPFLNRQPKIANEKPLVLVVEDNPDVQGYLLASLENNYQIELAKDGQEGIERATELVPDLVISDVMMPRKDGFELCRTLKKDERTSHIPIVLLTAKADISSKIEGLGQGADAYLAKPFHQEELFVRLKKLLELRRTLQARYAAASPITTLPVTMGETLEDAFLRKVQLIIEANLSDEDFDVTLLSRELNMSRSQVFRKVKALTGKSIVLFVRSYKLGRAMQMLQSTNLTVSEIAYQVGFKDPAYFTRVFQEEFGTSPSTTRK